MLVNLELTFQTTRFFKVGLDNSRYLLNTSEAYAVERAIPKKFSGVWWVYFVARLKTFNYKLQKNLNKIAKLKNKQKSIEKSNQIGLANVA